MGRGVALVEEKLPYADHAVVEQAKICDYLLSSSDPVGRFKARVFLSLGLHHGRTGTVQRIESNTYGMKVVISASLRRPNGTSRRFCTVWLIPDSSIQPRLITAFPE